MTAPVQDAPTVFRIERGAMIVSIPDHDGRELEYLVERVSPGFALWAVLFRRLDQRDGPYRVETPSPGRWTCTCRDSQFGAKKQGRLCKHRIAARDLYREAKRLLSHDHENEEASR